MAWRTEVKAGDDDVRRRVVYRPGRSQDQVMSVPTRPGNPPLGELMKKSPGVRLAVFLKVCERNTGDLAPVMYHSHLDGLKQGE